MLTSTERLTTAMQDAGVTFDGLAIYPSSGNPPGGGTLLVAPGGEQVRITPMLDPAEVPTAQDVVDTFTFGDAKMRPISAIYQDVNNLSASQKTNIWNDISAVVTGVAPRKYLADEGPNAAGIFALDWSVMDSGATGNSLLGARMRIISMYTQDNPSYLVAPPFDPTINVPGLEAV